MPIEGSDELLVNRSGTTYTLEQQNLMAEIQDDDLLLVNRSDTTYKVTGQELIDSVVPDLEIVVTFIPNVPYIDEVITVVPNTSGGVEPEGGYVFTYQWSISDDIEGNVNLTNILGANSNTYTPTEDQQGKFLGCSVQTTDARGTIANATGRTGPIDFKPATDPPVINSVVLTQDAVNDKRFSDNSFTTTVDVTNRPNQLAMEAQVVGALSLAVGTDFITAEDTDGIAPLDLTLASDTNLGDGRFEVGDVVKANAAYTPTTSEIVSYQEAKDYSKVVTTDLNLKNKQSAFDGDIDNTYAYLLGVGGGINVYHTYKYDFTHMGGVQVNSSIRIRVYTQYTGNSNQQLGVQASINGNNERTAPDFNGAVGWFDISGNMTIPGPMYSLEIGGSYGAGTDSVGRLFAVEVDGQVLVDADGVITLTDSTDINKFQAGDILQSDTIYIGDWESQTFPTTALPLESPISRIWDANKNSAGNLCRAREPGESGRIEFSPAIQVNEGQKLYVKYNLSGGNGTSCQIRVETSIGTLLNDNGQNGDQVFEYTASVGGFILNEIRGDAQGSGSQSAFVAIYYVAIDDDQFIQTGKATQVKVIDTNVSENTITVDGGTWDTSNQSEVWSNRCLLKSGAFYPFSRERDVENLFNGVLTNNDPPVANQFLEFDGSQNSSISINPAIAATTNETIKIWLASYSGYNPGKMNINGTTIDVPNVPSNNNGPILVDTGVTSLNELGADSQNLRFCGMVVDGNLLVDAVNDSQVWSGGITAGSSQNTSYPVANAFDGDLTTYSRASNDGEVQVDFTDLSDVTSVQIYWNASGGGQLYCNGNNVDGSAGSPTTIDVIGTGLSSVKWTSSGSGYLGVSAIYADGVLLVDTGARDFGDTQVSTISPKQGEGTISAINDNVVSLNPFVDNCFVNGQYLIHTSPKPIKITPKTEVITEISEDSTVLTFAGNDKLIEFANGDPVTMCDANGNAANALVESSVIDSVESFESIVYSNYLTNNAGGWRSGDPASRAFDGSPSQYYPAISNSYAAEAISTFTPPEPIPFNTLEFGMNGTSSGRVSVGQWSLNGSNFQTGPEGGDMVNQVISGGGVLTQLRILARHANDPNGSKYRAKFFYVKIDGEYLIDGPFHGTGYNLTLTDDTNLTYFKDGDVLVDGPYTGTNTQIYAGSNLSQSIKTSFSPDLVWIKNRTSSASSHLYDSLRGKSRLTSSGNNAQTDVGDFVSFDSDGFTLSNSIQVNQASNQYAAWCWDAGAAAPVTTNSGGVTMSTLVKANVDKGFSVCRYSGGGGNNSYSHGLGQAPDFVLVKRMLGAADWATYHSGIPLGNTGALSLNTTDAWEAVTNQWNEGIPPTNKAVYLANNANETNLASADYVAYNWVETAGVSKFGTYTGQSGNPVFIECGFKPALVIIKRYDSAGGNWVMISPSGQYVYANLANGIADDSTQLVEFSDTGFTVKGSNVDINSSNSYLYCAWSSQGVVASVVGDADVDNKLLVVDGGKWNPSSIVYSDGWNTDQSLLYQGGIETALNSFNGDITNVNSTTGPSRASSPTTTISWTGSIDTSSATIVELVYYSQYNQNGQGFEINGTLFTQGDIDGSGANIARIRTLDISTAAQAGQTNGAITSINAIRYDINDSGIGILGIVIDGVVVIDAGIPGYESIAKVAKSGTGVVSSVNLENNTMTLSSTNGEWVPGYYVSTPEKNAVEMRGYLSFDSQGNNIDLQRLPQSPVLMDDLKTPKLTFPASFSTGEGVDTDLPFPTYLETYVQASNDLGSSLRVKSNELFPNWTGRPYIAPGSYRVMQDEFADWCYWACSSDYRAAVKTIQDAEETVQELRTKAENMASNFLNRDDTY